MTFDQHWQEFTSLLPLDNTIANARPSEAEFYIQLAKMGYAWGGLDQMRAATETVLRHFEPPELPERYTATELEIQ